MPNNEFFESSKLEGKYWRARVEDLVDGLNDLGFFMPYLMLDEVKKIYNLKFYPFRQNSI